MRLAEDGSFVLRLVDAVFVSFLYVGLCHLSDLLSSNQAFANTSSILFLPAFVRLLGVLVAGRWSVPALFVGSYLCLDYIPGTGGQLMLAALLATGGPLAVFATMRILKIRPSLQSLSPVELLWLSLACSAGSSAFYNIGLALVGMHSAPLTSLAITFVGDLAGTWAMIYAIKLGMHVWLGWRHA